MAKIQKLTRAEAVELVKQEQPGIDFGCNDFHQACTTSEAIYLNELAPRLKYYRELVVYSSGSTGRAVYEYLARYKFPIWELWGEYADGKELLTIEVTLRDAKENVRAYHEAGDSSVFKKRRMVTQYQFDNLK